MILLLLFLLFLLLLCDHDVLVLFTCTCTRAYHEYQIKLLQVVDIQKQFFAYNFDAFSMIAFGMEMESLKKVHPFQKVLPRLLSAALPN